MDAFTVTSQIERMKKMLKNLLMYITETRITLGVKSVVAIVATIAIFGQDLVILFNDALQSETTSHLLAIPFLFVYLIYRKRKMLRAVIPIENKVHPKETKHLPLIAGILLFITAILLYWHGSYTFTPLEYHMFALPIFAAGLTLILFNPQTLRQLAFPIAFLAFLMPPPSEILYVLGTSLSVISSEAPNAIVNAFGIPSTITSDYGNPTIIITRPDDTTMPFTVDIACSGIYSLIGFTIFAVFIAYIIRDKPWKKITLIIIGLPLIYLLNILRITTILVLGYYYGEDLAFQIFHLLGGWILIFLGTLILLAISEKIFKTQIFTDKKDRCPQCNLKLPLKSFCYKCSRILKPPKIRLYKTDIAKISIFTVCLILLASIQAPAFALTQAKPMVMVNNQFSTEVLPQIPEYNLDFSSRETEFEAKAKQDMSLIYLYTSYNQSKEPVKVAIEIASTKSSLHRWETCLITWPVSKGYQTKVTQIELKDIKLNENPPIISRYFAFTYIDTNETQAVLYWFETAIFTINSTLQQKYVKISLIAYAEDTTNLSNIENQLVNIATYISNYWQPIKTWSQITMIISQNGATLAIVTTIVLMGTLILYALETKRQKRANTNAYQKLSKPNKQIVDAIIETEKTMTPTLEAIATTYQKITGKRISKEQLLKRLTEIETTNTIKSYVANRQDEPQQIWKTALL